jgi:dihydroorotate dehydrogenase (NAD+) catalytic subunit
MRIDTHSGRPILANVTGGLSGPAIFPLTLWLVYLVSQHVSVPVVGVGGVASLENAVELMMAGAAAVQIGTATFVDPTTSLRIVDGLPEALRSRGCASVSALTGLAHPGRRSPGRAR